MLILRAGSRTVACENGVFIEASGAPEAMLPARWTITPGLVDLQVNGLGDLSPLEDPSCLPALDAALAAHGVTSYLIAAPSSPPSSVAHLAHSVDAFMPGSGCRGLHLEGPVLNPHHRGAHALEHLREPDDPDARALLDLPHVRLVTLAPELPGAMEYAKDAMARGIVVGAGHTGATAEEAREAIGAGVTLCTHLFNAMTPVHQRAPGAGVAYLTDPRATVAFIADGVHLHDDTVALILAAARERCLIVSDAAPSRATADGVLAGSVFALDEGVRRVAKTHGLEFAAEIASARPAAILGEVASCAPGARADFVVWDETLAVRATVRAGEFVYKAF